MSRKILGSAAGVLAVSLLLAGCSGATAPGSPGSSGSSAAGDSTKLKSIFFANPLPSYPDWAVADQCFRDETKKRGIAGTTSGPTGLAVDNQFTLDRISQAIAQQTGAIMSVPIVPAQFEPLMKQAKSKGILLATLNTGDSTSTQNFTVGTDYKNQGATVAKEIAKRSGQQNIGIISNAPGGIGDTIINAFKDNLPSNLKVTTIAYDKGDPATTADVTASMLRAHPDINVVFSWEGNAVAGITTAIKEANLKGKVVAVVNDLTPQVQDGIKDGIIYGTSKQNFCKMATLSVDYLVKLSEGEKVPAVTDTGVTFVTKENLADAVADYNK